MQLSTSYAFFAATTAISYFTLVKLNMFYVILIHLKHSIKLQRLNQICNFLARQQCLSILNKKKWQLQHVSCLTKISQIVVVVTLISIE